MKLPARQTLIACGVTLAVASGSIAGARFLADSDKGDFAGTTALSSDAEWLAGIQQVAADGKSDRLALPNQAIWIVRDERTAPLQALVWADVIDRPRPYVPEPDAQTAAAAPPEVVPAVAVQEVERTFTALTFETAEPTPRVSRRGPLSIVPTRNAGSANSSAVAQAGNAQPSVAAVAFVPVPAPTEIVPSAQQNVRSAFQQPPGQSATKPLDYWDIR
jgi:hypothetical protein